jgi:predicted helicase
VKTHRTWVIAPDVQSLDRRWEALQKEKDATRRAALFHPDDARTLDTIVKVDLGPYQTLRITVGRDEDSLVAPIRYAFRSFDRQWLIPDHRLLSRARPKLWETYSEKQVYLTALDEFSPSSGPALTLTSVIPDQHHYHGRGGRVFPLWLDAGGKQSNVSPEIMGHLADIHAQPITAEDVMAYVAAVMAHSAFTARFEADLVRPGLRVPLTADRTLVTERWRWAVK